MPARVRHTEPLELGTRFAPDASQAHHLGRVLRARVGDEVEVVDGAGKLWRGIVMMLDPLTVRVLAVSEHLDASPSVEVELWVPVLKGGRTDDMVRQLTELGVATIVPFISARSVVRLDPDRADVRWRRWKRIAEEATKQCKRPDVPAVAPVHRLPERGPGVFLWEIGGPTLKDVLREQVAAHSGALRLLTGPEGGLAARESAHLERIGWKRAWLGPRILRAETASIVLTTLALSAAGEGGY